MEVAREERRRCSGLLLHISSLPSPFGTGDLGPEAYRFADFLTAAGQRIWQVLPLNPVSVDFGSSPYHSPSVLAGNPLFVSPELLAEEGYLEPEDIDPLRRPSTDRADFPSAVRVKKILLDKAFGKFRADGLGRAEYEEFLQREARWIDDFSLFTVLRSHRGAESWNLWPRQLRDRDSLALAETRAGLAEEIDRVRFGQFVFFRQWAALRSYCRGKGISLFGDLPVYPTYDSADVWANPDIFKLGENLLPDAVAGVPPDYFSDSGQLWGNPVYRWERLRATGFRWWIERIEQNLSLYDLLRIDHFRGLVAFWEVPVAEKTAVHGRWIDVPAEEFFHTLAERVDLKSLVAEDLGIITPDVEEVRDRFRFPGMKVLLFAFGDGKADNPYLPHNHGRNCVVYTGTHDNNTARGWFEEEASEGERGNLFRYLGRELPGEDVPWALIRAAMSSVADRVVVPVQDLLGLGAEARMNRPSVKDGNWRWRLLPGQLDGGAGTRLAEMAALYGRG